MICSICKSSVKVQNYHKKPYCSRHRSQLKKYGRIFSRTVFEPNRIIIKGDYAEIELYKKNIPIGFTQIDLEDIDKIKTFKWHRLQCGYIYNWKLGYLHRFLMKVPSEYEIDHRNTNRTDNRKENLRICKPYQNRRNNSINTKNTSGHLGVTYSKERNKWQAQLGLNYKNINLGRFNTKEEAIEARIKGEKKYYGEYAPMRVGII